MSNPLLSSKIRKRSVWPYVSYTAPMTKREPGEPKNVLFRIKRGLSGYVSYLAACEMNASFSEYVLYEPILRILTARGYSVQCEVECPGVEHRETGDRKRLDFVAKKGPAHFALEVKWAKFRSLNVENDYEKLAGFLASGGSPGRRAFLCVFGTERYIGDDLTLKPDRFTKVGKVWIAQFAVTRYGCRIFEAKSPTK
ncbi:MAG TPA: hypothetical protein VGI46_14235 [Candidatus Acidoferrum sp.]|jgi:hypothetical protein